MNNLNVGKLDCSIFDLFVLAGRIDLVFFETMPRMPGQISEKPKMRMENQLVGHWRHIPRPMVIVTTWPGALTLALDLAQTVANYVTLN